MLCLQLLCVPPSSTPPPQSHTRPHLQNLLLTARRPRRPHLRQRPGLLRPRPDRVRRPLLRRRLAVRAQHVRAPRAAALHERHDVPRDEHVLRRRVLRRRRGVPQRQPVLRRRRRRVRLQLLQPRVLLWRLEHVLPQRPVVLDVGRRRRRVVGRRRLAVGQRHGLGPPAVVVVSFLES